MKAINSLKTAVLAASLLLGPVAAQAEDAPRYDRKIEEAVIEILQGKLGGMRGALGLDTENHIVRPEEDGAHDLLRSSGKKRITGRIVWI